MTYSVVFAKPSIFGHGIIWCQAIYDVSFEDALKEFAWYTSRGINTRIKEWSFDDTVLLESTKPPMQV